MINFIKTLFFHFKKKYGYLAQRFTKEELSKVSKRVQDKQGNKIVSNLPNVEEIFGPNWLREETENEKRKNELRNKQIDTYTDKYVFPSYEAFEKACYAFIEEEKERERHTNKYPKRTIKRKTDGKVRTLRKQKGG